MDEDWSDNGANENKPKTDPLHQEENLSYHQIDSDSDIASKIGKHPESTSEAAEIPPEVQRENNSITNNKRHKIITWVVGIIILAIIFLLIQGLIHWLHHSKKSAVKPVPVVLGTAKKMDMPIFIPALGIVTALDTATVKTQINGRLQEIYYSEGQEVKAGELIALIDPRPYEAQLEQFQGQLLRDQALLANAKIDLARYETLFAQDSVSQQTLETQRWLVRQLEGTVQLDQGQIDQVKVNLIYCHITSPIDGQVGLRLVDLGNFVQTTDTTGLVIINTIQPISVVFTIPEDSLPQVLQNMDRGKGLVVEAYDRAQNKLLATGSVLSLDNQIDTTTGTVRVRALFKNEDKTLFPNQFVNVQLKVSTLQNAIVVPKTALQYGANGAFVYVVNKKDNQSFANVKPIAIRATVQNNAAITGDVLPNQEVVVEGGDNLAENTLIKSEPRNNQNHASENLIQKAKFSNNGAN